MGKTKALDHVVDSLDIETFLICRDQDEGERLGLQLVHDLGFKDADVVFAEYSDGGVRIRIRANVFRPGDPYAWCSARQSEAAS